MYTPFLYVYENVITLGMNSKVHNFCTLPRVFMPDPEYAP